MNLTEGRGETDKAGEKGGERLREVFNLTENDKHIIRYPFECDPEFNW